MDIVIPDGRTNSVPRGREVGRIRPAVGPGASREGHTARPGAPVVIGVGPTGLRIASSLAAREGRALRFLGVLPAAEGSRPTGPSSFPVIVWPASPEAAAEAAADLVERVRGARGAVVACNLSGAAATLAPEIARTVRGCLGGCAAVGVTPFSFEGPEKLQRATAASAALSSAVDVLALAERDRVRAIVPPDTALDGACRAVDGIAAYAAATLARTVGRVSGAASGLGAGALALGPGTGFPVGAAEASGPGAAVASVLAAVERSLLSAEELGTSRGAYVALALGRTPTLGEIGEVEAALRSALDAGVPSPGCTDSLRPSTTRRGRARAGSASVTVEAAVDPALGARALAAVLCLPAAEREEALFPAENLDALEVPAFLRKRAAGTSVNFPASFRRADEPVDYALPALSRPADPRGDPARGGETQTVRVDYLRRPRSPACRAGGKDADSPCATRAVSVSPRRLAG